MVEAESSLETSGFAKSVHLLGSLAEVGWNGLPRRTRMEGVAGVFFFFWDPPKFQHSAFSDVAEGLIQIFQSVVFFV